jgi:hypothetical protein
MGHTLRDAAPDHGVGLRTLLGAAPDSGMRSQSCGWGGQGGVLGGWSLPCPARRSGLGMTNHEAPNDKRMPKPPCLGALSAGMVCWLRSSWRWLSAFLGPAPAFLASAFPAPGLLSEALLSALCAARPAPYPLPAPPC